MKKYQKGLVIGGVVLAALTPAALVAADSWNGGNGGGRGNGSMDCDGSGRMQGQNGSGRMQGQHGQGGGAGQQLRDGSGPNHTAGDTVRPMDGTGTQQRGGR